MALMIVLILWVCLGTSQKCFCKFLYWKYRAFSLPKAFLALYSNRLCMLGEISVDFIYQIITRLPVQGVEQPDKDSSLKVQKDVAMKHPAPPPCVLLFILPLNCLWFICR